MQSHGSSGRCPSASRLLPGDSEPRAVIASDADEHSPALSPDGLWLAYASRQSGQSQIYIARFPGGDGPTPVTARGGWEPLWSSDGRELFFTAEQEGQTWTLNVVDVTPMGDRLELSEPSALFVVNDPDEAEGYQNGSNSGAAYDISPDGRRFLIVRVSNPQPATEIVVVENWLEELERLVPPIN